MNVDVVIWQVQLLSDNQRGATLEAVVSRMKTIHSLNAAELKQTSVDCHGIRFIAVSATIPNVSDVRPTCLIAGLIRRLEWCFSKTYQNLIPDLPRHPPCFPYME